LTNDSIVQKSTDKQTDEQEQEETHTASQQDKDTYSKLFTLALAKPEIALHVELSLSTNFVGNCSL